MNEKQKKIWTDEISELNVKGTIFHKNHKYDNALDCFMKAYEIAQNKVPNDRYWLGMCESNIGNAYFNKAEDQNEKGEYTKQGQRLLSEAKAFWEKSLERALQLSAELGYTRIPQLAEAYNNLGTLRRAEQKYDEALECFYNSLKIYLKLSFGKENSSTAVLYSNIAGIYLRKKDYQNGLIYNSKSLEIDIALNGEGHPLLVYSYNGIAICYDGLKEYEEAIKYYILSLNICLREFGKAHPQTAQCYKQMGDSYRNMKNYDLSLKNYENALLVKLSYLEEHNPQVKLLRERITLINSLI